MSERVEQKDWQQNSLRFLFRQFRQNIIKFAITELGPGASQRAKMDHIPSEVIHKLAQSGILGLNISPKHGGQPRDWVSIGIAFEEIAKIDFSPIILIINAVIVPFFLERAQEQLSAEWLPALCRGEKIVCFGNTEPDCGSDASAIKSRAVRDGVTYRITGEKTSISLGMQADAMIMTARTDQEAGARGITCFFVPLSLPSITRSVFSDMGFISAGRASIWLDNVRLPIELRIGEEGEGFINVMKGFDFTRVLVALAGIGMAEASLAEVSGYVKQRKAFGISISRFEGVSFKLAEDATLLEAARLVCYKALKLRDEGLPNSKEAAMAKWYSTECAVRALHDILLIFGNRGYSESNPVEQRLRDAIGICIGDGTAEIMKLIIAREIIGEKDWPIM